MASISNIASQVVHEVFDRVASDLSMLADRDIDILQVEYEERNDRPVGEGVIHISYRFGVMAGSGDVFHGALIVPLAESISLAGYLMMAPDAQVEAMRESGELDHAMKEAMLEVGNFVAAASDAALRSVGARCDRVMFEGCQGVHANVRPALEYEEGAALSVGRARISVAGSAPVECIVMLPKERFLTGAA